MSRRPFLLVLAPAVVLGVTACGATLPATTVATGAADALEKKVGVRPHVTCPNGLDATAGATTRCTLTAAGDTATYGVTVTVTSVEHGNAHFDVTVDQKPQG